MSKYSKESFQCILKSFEHKTFVCFKCKSSFSKFNFQVFVIAIYQFACNFSNSHHPQLPQLTTHCVKRHFNWIYWCTFIQIATLQLLTPNTESPLSNHTIHNRSIGTQHTNFCRTLRSFTTALEWKFIWQRLHNCWSPRRWQMLCSRWKTGQKS